MFPSAGIYICDSVIAINIEPETFGNYFRAVYWATVSLTAMGYGDIYPVTQGGQVLTMISSMFGIAIVALPAGILTAGHLEEVGERDKAREAKESDIRNKSEKNEGETNKAK